MAVEDFKQSNKDKTKTESADKADKEAEKVEDGEEENKNDELVSEVLEQYEWDAANRLNQTNQRLR